MSVGPTGPVGGPGPIDPREAIHKAEPKIDLPPIQDRIQASESGRLVSQALQIDPIRAERIQELKNAVVSGTLETPERLEAALLRFLEQNRDLAP